MRFSSRRNTSLRVRLRGALEPPPGYEELVSVRVAIEGPVAIWSSRSGAQALHEAVVQEGFASFPRSQPIDEPAVALTAYSMAGAPVVVVPVDRLPVAHPHLQRLVDGSFLVVGARCQWSEEGPEENAIVYGPDGSELRRGTLGDGIEHVLVSDNAWIWAGYFDEGVFGNYGWGGPGPEPLGAPGIVAWTSELAQAWSLDPSQGLISDCYALNVDHGVVWACPYTDFPVVRISEGRVQTWPTENVSGPRGIVVDGDRVALIGSYSDPSDLVLGRLVSDRFREERRGRLLGPDGSPLAPSVIRSAGPIAHFFAARTWWSFDLRDVA